ncbi:MAG: hypothetical protein K6L81_17085 [Agarilytica sp.]
MNPYYEINKIGDVTAIRILRKSTYKELLAVINEIATHHPYHKRLWNISGINFDLSLDEIQQMAMHGKLVYTNPSKVAVVASDDLAYGEMNQFRVFREQQGFCSVKQFRDEKNAIEWLNTED